MPLLSRPTATEMLDGVTRSLATYIGPQLETDQQRQRLTSAMALIGYVSRHWDTAAQDFVDEIESLESVLADTVAPLREGGQADFATRIETLVGKRVEGLAISVLAARSDVLQGGLLDLVLLVQREQGVNASIDALRPRVMAELAAHNRRRL